MQNAFLIVRAIFLILILYFNLLGTIFATWNIVSSSSSGMPVPGAAVFLVVNTAFIFVFVTLTYAAEVICSKARPAHVRFECGWTILMGILQLSASIYVTTTSPSPLCQSQAIWTVCASAALLVPISWLTTFIMLAYCVTLCVMAVTHVHFMPDLWATPVSLVPWFNLTDSAPHPVAVSLPPRISSQAFSIISAESDDSCNVSKFIAESWGKLSRVEGRVVDPPKLTRGSSTGPAWAKQLQCEMRRGVDQPFSTRGLSPPGRPPKMPSPLLTARVRQVAGSNDVEPPQTRMGLQLTRNLSLSTLTPQTPTIFPKKIADPDLPIPRPRLSEWLPADAATTIDGHPDDYPQTRRVT